MKCETSFAYLCLVTWPNGTTGLLFPRPGNVPIADTEEQGRKDMHTACKHMKEFADAAEKAGEGWKLKGSKIQLVKYQALHVLDELVYDG